MIQEQKLKYFFNKETGKQTKSFNVAKRWVDDSQEVVAFLDKVNTTKITEIAGIYFSTEAGNSYKITEVDGEIKDVLVDCFVNKTTMQSCSYARNKSLKTVKPWIERGDDVCASFFDIRYRVMSHTSRIVVFDSSKRQILTIEGKMYHVIPFG